MAQSMGADDWAFIKNMAAEQGVTLKDAGVNIRQTLGYAIDLVFVAHERKYPQPEKEAKTDA